jgi:hypothetical protein
VGLRDVTLHTYTAASDNTFGIAREGEVMTFKSISSQSALKNVVADKKLTWVDLIDAKVPLLKSMELVNWPQEDQDVMYRFFVLLEIDPMKPRPYGEQTLVKYFVQTFCK